MATLSGNLRVLSRSVDTREVDLASKLFHRLNRIIPQDQTVLTIPPNCLVRDALVMMRKHKFSQIPVCKGSSVLGVFSLRSLAQEVAKASLEDWTKQKCTPGDLPVDDFLEQFEFARVTEEMSRVIDVIARDDGILIGTPERLVGILTPIDVLRYLEQVSSPFVLVSEIELALRALIRVALDPEQLAIASKVSLKSIYGGDESKVPLTLEEMTFDNYQSILSRADNWPLFEPVFGGTRTRLSGKLKELGLLRNDLFHFKREITLQDHEVLVDHRNWLLNKIKQTDTTSRSEGQV
jgi:predicted transcriptional regulator